MGQKPPFLCVLFSFRKKKSGDMPRFIHFQPFRCLLLFTNVRKRCSPRKIGEIFPSANTQRVLQGRRNGDRRIFFSPLLNLLQLNRFSNVPFSSVRGPREVFFPTLRQPVLIGNSDQNARGKLPRTRLSPLSAHRLCRALWATAGCLSTLLCLVPCAVLPEPFRIPFGRPL